MTDIAAGWIVLTLTGAPSGMLAMVALGLVAASSVIVVQRLCWRSAC